jgi:hypothetical protein
MLLLARLTRLLGNEGRTSKALPDQSIAPTAPLAPKRASKEVPVAEVHRSDRDERFEAVVIVAFAFVVLLMEWPIA